MYGASFNSQPYVRAYHPFTPAEAVRDRLQTSARRFYEKKSRLDASSRGGEIQNISSVSARDAASLRYLTFDDEESARRRYQVGSDF